MWFRGNIEHVWADKAEIGVEVAGGHTWEAAALPESRVATTCCMSAEKCCRAGRSRVGVKVGVYGRGKRAEGSVGLEK
jgi:hypothetical protein